MLSGQRNHPPDVLEQSDIHAIQTTTYLVFLVVLWVVVVSGHLRAVARKVHKNNVVFLRFRAKLGKGFANVGTSRDELIRAGAIVLEDSDLRLVKTFVALQNIAHDIDVCGTRDKQNSDQQRSIGQQYAQATEAPAHGGKHEMRMTTQNKAPTTVLKRNKRAATDSPLQQPSRAAFVPG